MAEYIERDKIFSTWRSMPAPASITSLSAAIHQTPVADVAPVRHGRWTDEECGFARCSLCGCAHEIEFIEHDYCPNCGARMDGEG